ncbi:MAG: DNA topoisomerase IV subunit A [Acetobacter sp.]|nr:DNA topoisomerase IV subunit A [Acetobacter sp.]
MHTLSEEETIGHVEEVKLADALQERYLAYALSTIMSRSLPDVRDGLKPVHRRLIYAMHQLKLDPASGFKKCARVVGDVIGKFHPHGDSSVYEALVRLAQDFAVRYPLVEGQGNFGSIDGDNPAAMRYTEARLTDVAVALLEGIEENAVDFQATYDGEEQEPYVLPAAFPNLLANGATGIAVGMATSIPPHNAAEICQAAALLVQNPEVETRALLSVLQGPDFPTGGLIMEEAETILQAYETGRGSFRVRARWAVEQGRFGTWQIVVTEIPYQVQKSRLIEHIAQLLEQKKLPLLEDIRDESTDEIRLVFLPKSREVKPEVLMEMLFQATALENRFSLNMNVINAHRSPMVMGLRQVLRAWLDHRHEVLERRYRYRLQGVARRLEILAGFLSVYMNLDRVIQIVREEDDPKAVLIATFALTDLQAETVLNMRLRALRKLEEMAIRREYETLSAEKTDLLTLLGDEKLRWQRIEAELQNMADKFSRGEKGQRRSTILSAPRSITIPTHEMIEREPVTVVLSQKGWVKALQGHTVDLEKQKFKEGDSLRTALQCMNTDKICLFATDGRSFTVKVSDIYRSGRHDGQAVRLLVDLPNDQDIVSLFVLEEEKLRLLVAHSGRGMLVENKALIAEKRTGRQVFNLKEKGDYIQFCVAAQGDQVAILGDNHRLLIFPLDQVPIIARGSGVVLQKYANGGGVQQIKVFSAADGLLWSDNTRLRSMDDLKEWCSRRAAVGKRAPLWAR